MKWPIFGWPLIEWGRPPHGQSGGGGRRVWFTNLDGLTLFPWSRPANSTPPIVTRSARVAGEISAVFTLPPPRYATVAGQISATFGSLAGTVTISGSAHLVGEVTATFAPSMRRSARVAGEITAKFYSRGGQDLGCIVGPGVPAADVTTPTPWNAAY